MGFILSTLEKVLVQLAFAGVLFLVGKLNKWLSDNPTIKGEIETVLSQIRQTRKKVRQNDKISIG